MLALFLRYRTSILLLLVTLLGLACGQLAGAILQARDNAEPPRPGAGKTAGVTAKTLDPASELAFILQNNPFDAGARTAAPASFLLGQEEGLSSTAPAGDLELRGTVVAGKRSLALIRSGAESKLYRLGEELPGGGTLEEVSRHEVKIQGPGPASTTLSLIKGGATPSTGPSPAAGGQAAVAGNALQQVGPNRWIIPRSEVEAIRGNFSQQLGMALMQPHTVNGRTDGFVIKRIAKDSLLNKMGLIRGDIVKQVNAMTVDSPEKALQILQQLREARQLTVALERNGTPLTFNYEID